MLDKPCVNDCLISVKKQKILIPMTLEDLLFYKAFEIAVYICEVTANKLLKKNY